MKLKRFKDFIQESEDSSEFGLSVYGDILRVVLKKEEYTNLLSISYSGDKMLTKLKSIQTLRNEYQESDWDKLDIIYSKATNKASKNIDKAVKKFESEINKVLKDFETTIGKL